MMDVMHTEIFDITVANAGKRLDSFLSDALPDYSRSLLQLYITQQCIQVNAHPTVKSYRLRLGDQVVCHIPMPAVCETVSEPIPLDIVFEDEALMVVHKPQGMVVHPSPGHYTGTLVNALLYHCGTSLSGIGGVQRPGIVHRIDKDTSGLMVIAKTDRAHQGLAEQLARHDMRREYHGIACRVLSQDRLRIDLPLGRHPENRLKRAVVAEGKQAVTHITVRERFENHTLFEARLETGRTHQIRVHMAHIGHPLVGDALYGGSDIKSTHLQGQALHAATLGFTHPYTGTFLLFNADWPPYFVRLVDRLRSGGQC